MTSTESKTKTDFLEYATTLGMTTMEGRGFYYPTDASIGSNGRIYVVNRSVDTIARGVRVCMLDKDSEYYGNFASYGEGDGQFVWPGSTSVDSRGRVYICDEYLHRITAFTSAGEFLYKWGVPGSGEGELDIPSAIAFDSRDNPYVSDTYNHRVQKFSPEGRFQLSFGSQGSDEGEFEAPWGLTLDAEDNVYVADFGNDRIQKFTADGKFLASFGTPGRGDGELHRPSSVAVDKDGYIYVADWGNERVQVLDSDGNFVTKVRGESHLSKWAQNFLDINVEEKAARATANLEPELEYFVSDPHEESSHIEKYFWSPRSVKLDADGVLYITDSNRHRIQVYKRSS